MSSPINKQDTGKDTEKDMALRFFCVDYKTRRFVTGFNTEGDPTTSSGACKVCGSHNWRMD